MIMMIIIIMMMTFNTYEYLLSNWIINIRRIRKGKRKIYEQKSNYQIFHTNQICDDAWFLFFEFFDRSTRIPKTIDWAFTRVNILVLRARDVKLLNEEFRFVFRPFSQPIECAHLAQIELYYERIRGFLSWLGSFLFEIDRNHIDFSQFKHF